MSEVSKESFAKRNTLAILSVLRDLKKNQTLVMVSHSRGQFISKILDVDADNHQFLFDLGSSDYENTLAAEAGTLTLLRNRPVPRLSFPAAESARSAMKVCRHLPAIFRPCCISFSAVSISA